MEQFLVYHHAELNWISKDSREHFLIELDEIFFLVCDFRRKHGRICKIRWSNREWIVCHTFRKRLCFPTHQRARKLKDFVKNIESIRRYWNYRFSLIRFLSQYSRYFYNHSITKMNGHNYSPRSLRANCNSSCLISLFNFNVDRKGFHGANMTLKYKLESAVTRWR